MTVSTKTECTTYRNAVRGGLPTATISAHKNLAKFGRVFIRYASGQTNEQTDRQTDTVHHSTLQPYRGRSNQHRKLETYDSAAISMTRPQAIRAPTGLYVTLAVESPFEK